MQGEVLKAAGAVLFGEARAADRLPGALQNPLLLLQRLVAGSLL